jgi:hypothetical protein
MKLRSSISRTRACAGIYLMECLVYLAVLSVIVGLGLVAFYKCLDNSKALRHATDDIATVLHVGECWRDDIRGAKGRIIVEPTADGQVLRIPRGTDEILYSFSAGDVRRKMSTADSWNIVLQKVKSSRMEIDTRGHATACRWEVELTPRRTKMSLRLLFTFEAVPSATS